MLMDHFCEYQFTLCNAIASLKIRCIAFESEIEYLSLTIGFFEAYLDWLDLAMANPLLNIIAISLASTTQKLNRKLA